MIFFVKIGILVFHVHLEIFCNICFPDQCQNSVKCFQVWSNMLLKIIQIHSLNLLNFVHIVVFDVETTLQNARFQSDSGFHILYDFSQSFTQFLLWSQLHSFESLLFEQTIKLWFDFNYKSNSNYERSVVANNYQNFYFNFLCTDNECMSTKFYFQNTCLGLPRVIC